ncbi:MAG TPA: preprotein translocase subunit SecG [Coprothermobacter proteolyticus]|uniref:Protein-export membrane protein SecG n=1 Tax=Coprothermobacter proteolyticus (strain ATCC 35245 / DSM 5265 / OCM 4 / BT) TaxID=309798 RepID=B5Y8I2_COPPD|nr:preprotein translocase subunit SecG [Coprothermobacter proteolyticus]MBK6585661.1 preprotein translocase subunit SecG [Coprothermobacter sp.]ACI17010.1 preprotein translocase subunit SecG [Coprothermobacter proteolyticus DSM 5265]MBP8983174.1 preprotein translocase subunit SecG [Coprothermobacter sp.]NLT83305.1 preprotein translocase subunit SecG [Coprothermobacter proteolyticus]HHY43633.1 preprotein translocase subunit SecG [Coprothermobacter sp.]
MKQVIMIVLGIVSFVLLLLITLQEPKEEGLGAIGGSASMFHGASPRSKLFDKLIIGFGVAYVLLVILAVVLK